MDLTLTPDQELIRTTARELLGSRAGSAGVRAVRGGEPGYSVELWKEMVELGWTGLAVPEDYGGVGEGWLELCLLIEEMGAAQVPGPFLTTLGCVAPVIARFGSEAQRSRWLPAIAGGRVVSYAGDWSGAGVDAAGGTLDGSVRYVQYAAAADDLLVAASDGAYLVEAGAPGISVTPLDVIGPDRLYRVDLAGVAVSGEDRLGGPEVIEAIDAFGTAATCAAMVGGAQRVLDLTVEYAGQRAQFGRPIGSFQAVQHHCADMAIDVLCSRFIAYEAIWRLTAGVDAQAEVALTVSAAKAWVSDAYQRVCALGQQVHGAIGFTEEHDLHLYLAHATSTALTFGDADHHTDRVASHLGLARESGLSAP